MVRHFASLMNSKEIICVDRGWTMAGVTESSKGKREMRDAFRK